jgi:hypothetical protein
MTNQTDTDAPLDYDGKMQAHLQQVWGERDPQTRMRAIEAIYAPDLALFEPESQGTGHASIDHAVAAIWARAPAEFVFSSVGPAVGHHDVARLRWRFGPKDGPAAVSGTDVATFAGGRIATLYVFLDPTRCEPRRLAGTLRGGFRDPSSSIANGKHHA